MIKKSSKLISGVLAFAVYFTIIGLLLFYFNTREEKKSIHYVKKNEHRIQVALTTPKNKKKPKIKQKVKPRKVKPKSKIKPKKKPIVKSKPKKVLKKKILKEKITKKIIKKKDENRTRQKKRNTLDLFANVKTIKKKNIIEVTDKPIDTNLKKNIIKVTDKPKSASERISSSLKIQKRSDSGVEHAYFAKIEEKLKGWPAQSEYAGEMAKVWIKVEPSGLFTFKVISASNNEAFNSGLITYLKQLQKFGFGHHKGERAYELNVEFIATD